MFGCTLRSATSSRVRFTWEMQSYAVWFVPSDCQQHERFGASGTEPWGGARMCLAQCRTASRALPAWPGLYPPRVYSYP
jgi:hypothetical protein